MDYELIVNGLNKIGSVLSVQLAPDGSCGDICLEAANDIYLKSVNVDPKDFVPGKLYSEYVPASRNYEAMSYRCVKENRMIHSYINVELYNAWMEVYMLPLRSDEKDKAYYLFAYDMTPGIDAEKLSDLSPDIAVQVLQITVKLRESDDFVAGMDSIIKDIRTNCEAKRCCILLTDFKNRNCSVLTENVDESEGDIPNVSSYLDKGFFNIVETWDKLIAGSNCYIIHDINEMELLKEKSPIWYDSLKLAGVYSLVIYPLKSHGETIGYIWATNFNSDNTLKIKSILEVTSFLLASEISSYQLLRRMKVLSDTDLLTGLYNRNAMNNHITDIVSGITPLSSDYGVVFADLNGLKTINDTKGHVAGDELLKGAACMLKDVFPDSELYRIGGDEFLAIDTLHSEEDFNARVRELVNKTECSSTIKLAVGAGYNSVNTDIRTAMQIADEKMYINKDDYYNNHPELKHRVV